jgi:hypothetical protein
MCIAVLAVACNSANPPNKDSTVPDSAAAGMTNTNNNRTVYPESDSLNSPPNKSIINTDTSLRDTRNHFVDTSKTNNGRSK